MQVHLLAVAERVAALGAAGAGWMEMVVVAGLQHFSAYVAIAIGTLDAEQLLIAFLAVRRAVFAHVLAVQHRIAVFASVENEASEWKWLRTSRKSLT